MQVKEKHLLIVSINHYKPKIKHSPSKNESDNNDLNVT